MSTPSALQNKVFIDLIIYFGNRVRKKLRDITQSDFIVYGKEYIVLKDHKAKIHGGDLYDVKKSEGAGSLKFWKILQNIPECHSSSISLC